MKKNVTSLSLALISVCLLFSKGEIQEGSQEIESFSISLNVKDVVVSKTFYEKLGFKPVPNAGSVTQKWVIMQNGKAKIGLFQGLFPQNTITINPSDARSIYNHATKKGLETLECDIVLSAAGIETNLDNIGLETLGIKTEKGRVMVDEFYKTNVDGIYAIGDITPGPALAHVASAEGIICVEKIAGEHTEPLDYNNIPGCTYCSPEIASVGYTEAQAIEKGYEIKVGKFPFSASGKASAAGAKEGFVKVIFDAKYGEWLGAHFIGAGVTDMIAEAVVARKLETTGHEILKAVHPHPTMSEAVMEAVAQAYDECIHL